MAPICYRIVITGKVQGVGFRHFLRNKAEEEKVTGWARNLSTGEVEAFLQGKEKNIQNIIEWAKVGPTNASVDVVFTEKQPCGKICRSFEIRE